MTNQLIYDSVCHIKKNSEEFTPRQAIHGLGFRGRPNNLNIPRFRLLKTQENFPLQASKLYDDTLPQGVTVMSLKRFES